MLYFLGGLNQPRRLGVDVKFTDSSLVSLEVSLNGCNAEDLAKTFQPESLALNSFGGLGGHTACNRHGISSQRGYTQRYLKRQIPFRSPSDAES